MAAILPRHGEQRKWEDTAVCCGRGFSGSQRAEAGRLGLKEAAERMQVARPATLAVSSRMKLLVRLLILCAVPLFTAPAAERPAKLLPVDEAARDPSFFLFRARLLDAVARRDVPAILQVLAPDILNSFGGNGGIAEFKEMWKPEAPDSLLWTELARALAMGGKFEGRDEFQAPYVAATWPELDPFENGAIVGENVRVRARPDKNAEVLASLSFDIVEVLDWGGEPGPEQWVKMKLRDGREGYVAAVFIASGACQRAHFSRQDGAWKMVAFVAGD